jgi:hypothetical protein
MFLPKNRLDGFFDPTPPAPCDLLSKAYVVKLELLRCEEDDGTVDSLISFQVHGVIGSDDDGTLAALLSQFRQPRGTEGAA